MQPSPTDHAPQRLTATATLLLLANLLVGAVWLNSGYHGLQWHRQVQPRLEGRVVEAVRDDWTIPWRAFYHQGYDEVMYFEYTNQLLGDPVDYGYLRAKHGFTPGFERYFEPSPARGRLPYRDAWTEYPPLALPFMLLPRVLTDRLPEYGFWFAVEMACLLTIALALAVSMIADCEPDPRERQRKVTAALAYGLCFQWALGTMLITRYDAAVSCLILAALYAHRRRAVVLGGFLLAAAAGAKVFPLLLAPLFYLPSLLQGDRRRALRGVAAFAAGCVAFHLPLALVGGDGFWDVFRYHAERGLEANSSWSALLVGLHKLGLVQAAGEFRFGSVELDGPLVPWMIAGSAMCSLALPLVVVGLYVRRMQQGYSQREMLPTFCLAMTAAFIVSGKVFSPQYVVWCFPLVLLVPGPLGSRARAVLLFIALLVQLDHPWLRGLIGVDFPLSWFGWSLIAGRAVGVGYLGWLALRALPTGERQRTETTPLERSQAEPAVVCGV